MISVGRGTTKQISLIPVNEENGLTVFMVSSFSPSCKLDNVVVPFSYLRTELINTFCLFGC